LFFEHRNPTTGKSIPLPGAEDDIVVAPYFPFLSGTGIALVQRGFTPALLLLRVGYTLD
jgi:hypothetical protein